MTNRKLLLMLLPLAYLIIISMNVQAATITTCIFNKTIYNQGETGFITVTIYNDLESKIKVTELTATIDYYYTDENIYLQQFFTDSSLPIEVQQGQSETFTIPFSLPTNIAAGYTTPLVKAKTELWSNQLERWFPSEHPVYQPTLCIESPYKQLFESQQAFSDQLQQQYLELQEINMTTTNMMYLLAITTTALAAIVTLFMIFSRKARIIPQSAA